MIGGPLNHLWPKINKRPQDHRNERIDESGQRKTDGVNAFETQQEGFRFHQYVVRRLENVSCLSSDAPSEIAIVVTHLASYWADY